MKKGYLFQLLKILLWIIIIGWMSVVAIDYVLVKKSKEPIFCIKNEVLTEEDTTTKICTGLGYKYYDVVSSEYIMKKFIPFWVEPNLGE